MVGYVTNQIKTTKMAASSTTFTPVKIIDLLLVKDRDICLSCSKNRIKENKFVVIDKFVSFDSKISPVLQYTSLPFKITVDTKPVDRFRLALDSLSAWFN